MDCKALIMLVVLLVILSTAYCTTICEQSITTLDKWDPYARFTDWERFENTTCENTQFPANFHDVGCCSKDIKEVHWKFNHEEINEKVILTCYIEGRSGLVPLGYVKFTSDEKDYCKLTSSSLMKYTSKTNTLQMDFTSNPFCILCIPGKNSAEFFNAPSKEVNSDEKGKGPGQQCDCGKSKKAVLKNRIINGTDVTNLEKYPWIVSVRRKLFGQSGHICGGSVVSKRHVITAGHCAAGKRDLEIMMGVTNLNSVEATIIQVASKFVHEKYFSDGIIAMYDIAILVLAQEVPENMYMPICIPKTLLAKERDPLTLIGWGLMGLYDSNRDVKQLKKAHIKLVGESACEEIYGATNFTRENQLCAFSTHQADCSGDSGGPFMFVDPQTDSYNLVGISSYGAELCEVLPAAVTAIHYYYDWIKEKIEQQAKGNEEKCNISI